MKKTLIIFMMALLVLMACTTVVHATTTFGVSLTPSATSVKQGDTVKVTLAITNLSSTDANIGLSALGANIDYDKTVFDALIQDEDIQTDLRMLKQSWDFPKLNDADGKIVTATSSYLKTNADLMEITFKVKDSAKLGNTTITLKNIVGSDNVQDIPVADASCQIQITDKSSSSATPTPTPTPAQTVTKPVVTVKYENVANGVKVVLTSTKELKPTTGWELSSDKKQLSRVYTSNYSGTMTVESTDGVKSDAITINAVVTTVTTPTPTPSNTTDKTAPTASVTYTKGTNGVTVTVKSTEELKPVTGWTLSSDKKTLTRVFSSNYTGTIVLEDLAGNKSNSIEIKVDTSLPNGGTNVDNAGAKTNSPVKATETSATDKLPKTGSAMIIPMIALAGLVGTFTYFKYRGMKY